MTMQASKGIGTFLSNDGGAGPPPPPSGFQFPAVPSIAFGGSRYESAIDPFVGATAVTLVTGYQPARLSGAFQQIAGNFNGGGGLRLALFQNTLLLQVVSTAGMRTLFANVPSVKFWAAVAITIEASGADMQLEIFVNGSRLADATEGGAGGALPAGGVFTLGSQPGGAEPAPDVSLFGCGYASRVITPTELADQFIAIATAGRFQDVSGGFDEAYRVGNADPGDPWVPFVGADALTRTGAPVSYAGGGVPLYR